MYTLCAQYLRNLFEKTQIFFFILTTRSREHTCIHMCVCIYVYVYIYIIPLLSMCFTSLFVHGILPESMISVILVPIVKNKSASICNYRPIALTSIASKVFEKFIYDHITYNLTTCSNQFQI